MATFDYSAIANDALQLIEEFGTTFTINRYSSVSDPVTGETSRVLQNTQTLAGAILPASQGTLEAFDVRFMSESVMASLDLRFVILSAVGATFIPSPMDEAYFSGFTWQVMGCTPLNVTGADPIIFSTGFRKP